MGEGQRYAHEREDAGQDVIQGLAHVYDLNFMVRGCPCGCPFLGVLLGAAQECRRLLRLKVWRAGFAWRRIHLGFKAKA